MKPALRTAFAACCLAALCACETPADVPAGDPEQIASGKGIAERDCAGCHALDRDARSPRADAPPMRDLLARYDEDALANDLINGIKLGHQDMPRFDFNVIGADDLIAYLRSLRSSPGSAPQ